MGQRARMGRPRRVHRLLALPAGVPRPKGSRRVLPHGQTDHGTALAGDQGTRLPVAARALRGAVPRILAQSVIAAIPYAGHSAGGGGCSCRTARRAGCARSTAPEATSSSACGRSEEHTSELQSLAYLVCRLLLEKKKKK